MYKDRAPPADIHDMSCPGAFVVTCAVSEPGDKTNPPGACTDLGDTVHSLKKACKPPDEVGHFYVKTHVLNDSDENITSNSKT